MKYVFASDSFKESLSSSKACRAMRRGFERVFPTALYEEIPVADGGEGTLASIAAFEQIELVNVEVQSPLGEIISAQYAISGDTAFVELAQASGLMLVDTNKRNPLRTSTYGVGECISAALDRGCSRIVIGIGGSATNDGGCGALTALGCRFMNLSGEELPPGGGALKDLARINVEQLDPRLAPTVIEIACDVENPLTGEHGASVVYGKQKGGSEQDIQNLDAALRHFAAVLRESGRPDVECLPGAGAAGGFGAGFVALLGAKLRPGFELIAELIQLKERMQGASLVITGEGECSGQTAFGKAPVGVASLASALGIPTVSLVGALGDDFREVYRNHIGSIFSIVPGPCTLEYAMQNSEMLLEDSAERVAKLWSLAMCSNA